MTPAHPTLGTLSRPSTYHQTGVHHGYRTGKASLEVPDGLVPFTPTRAWYGALDPGGFIVPHIDRGPWWVRWHIPLEPAGMVWMNGEIMRSPTEPFEMRHHEPHAVWNDTDRRRVHLIVETDIRLRGNSPLVLCDMLPEIQTLIDNLG